MAHFAEIDNTSQVLRVIVVSDFVMLDDHGKESEALGAAFCQSLFGPHTKWLQTSYRGTFRKNFAAAGFTFDAERNAFIVPKPEADYLLFDEKTCCWYDPALVAVNPTIGVTRA